MPYMSASRIIWQSGFTVKFKEKSIYFFICFLFIFSAKLHNDCVMAVVCIACEAFLQSCLENLLCDECGKPAEPSLEKESVVNEGVEDPSLLSGFAHRLQIMKFQRTKNRTSRVKRKLIFYLAYGWRARNLN